MNDGRILATIRSLLHKNAVVAGIAVASGLAAGLLAMVPFVVRLLLALAGAFTVLVMAEKRPRTLVMVLFAVLPFLGLLRRLLIPVAGWSGTDPLLLISPAAVVFIIAFWVVKRPDPALGAPLSRGVTLFVLICVVQMFNPLQGLAVGPIGGLFQVPPILWFYVGASLVDDGMLDRMFTMFQWLALITGLYGLYQTFFGLLPVEEAWVALAGYNSLYVGNVVRAISTFASAAEYALFLNIGIVISVARAMHTGKIWYLAPVAVYFPALFLESSRGPIVFLICTVGVMFAMRAQNRLGVFLRFLSVIIVSGFLVWSLAKVMSVVHIGGPLGSLIEHQVYGLLHPADEEHSTANLHTNMFWEGIWRGIKNPFGRGVGSITLAASKFGAGGQNWEVDLSNAFYSMGMAGGFTYLWLLVATVGIALATFWRTRNPVLVTLTAVLLVAIGQWWNSGYYVTTPLVWLLVGFLNTYSWTTAQPHSERGKCREGGPGHAQRDPERRARPRLL